MGPHSCKGSKRTPFVYSLHRTALSSIRRTSSSKYGFLSISLGLGLLSEWSLLGPATLGTPSFKLGALIILWLQCLTLLGCPKAKGMPTMPELFTKGLQNFLSPCDRGLEQETLQCCQSLTSEQLLQDARKPAAIAAPPPPRLSGVTKSQQSLRISFPGDRCSGWGYSLVQPPQRIVLAYFFFSLP